MAAEFVHDGTDYYVTDDVKAAFDKDGGFIVRNLLDREEIDKILTVLSKNDFILKRAWDLDDGAGKASRLSIWSHPGNDVTGMVARSEKLAGTCEKVIGGEVYHYHTKLMMKEARTGGAHLWHQDYGYWYKNGCLRPDMLTVFVALDPCTKENGCIQILPGTHRCGRIDHELKFGQTVAESVRMDELLKRHELVHVELNPGDALFFHSNVLHTSNQNLSDKRRWAFLVAYNRADNDPIYKHHHPNYTPLQKVPNSAIKECQNYTDMTGKDFMDPKIDKTVKVDLLDDSQHK